MVSYPSAFSTERVTGCWNTHEFYSMKLGAGPLLVSVFLSEENYALDEICSRQYLHKCTDSTLKEVKGSEILKDSMT